MSNNLDTIALSLCPSLDWDRDKQNWVEGFKGGVGLLQGFAEWLEENVFIKNSIGEWFDFESNLYAKSTEELIAKYIQFITTQPKEDARQ